MEIHSLGSDKDDLNVMYLDAFPLVLGNFESQVTTFQSVRQFHCHVHAFVFSKSVVGLVSLIESQNSTTSMGFSPTQLSAASQIGNLEVFLQSTFRYHQL